MQKKKSHFHRKAALISLDKLQDIVYLAVTMGLVIEKRCEYGQDKATEYAYFDESIWQDKQRKDQGLHRET